MIPFQPAACRPEELSRPVVEARRRFYSWPSIVRRGTRREHLRDPWMWVNFLVINAMHHWDVETRSGLPLGDRAWTGQWIEAL